MYAIADIRRPLLQTGGLGSAANHSKTVTRPTRIALIGNALPRLCGLATFTSHVYDALVTCFPECSIDHYAMVDPGGHYCFPESVTRSIEQTDVQSHRYAAQAIRASDADLIWVQHEFGIFGGPAGCYFLQILEQTDTPLAVSLHTVLETPDSDQREVIERIADRAALLIVMAERARSILIGSYGVCPAKIAVIPHGIPDRAYVEPALAQRCFGLEERPTILTFGLLSPGKGIETMIEALPAILKRCPSALYAVIGATHPHLLASENEAYRERLQALATALGVAGHVHWVNRFLCEADLLERIAAADVYVTPYGNPAQITSGALAYAFGLGKPIVSTPYIHACELLADGGGQLVSFGDVAGTAKAVANLLTDNPLRAKTAKIAYAHGRSMTWHNMVRHAMDHFALITAAAAPVPVSTARQAGYSNGATRQVALEFAASY
ncbi:hypothetical protein GCM10008023_39120 [Sphingomonas glacialis]|uniref:Glycosyltransferase n=1 Tax=Sphingomonas glacialis TaxID=658225 RepID=A0ABQ3LUH3_9SPHN|nr:glycosyltransferase family 4 protein [Sphingomonas glacialis]GHH25600.1 hypothetical protein GCM10008023_39120 [Sphingomonas glacialis]